MKHHPDQAADLTAFTYFKDVSGLIYYASGDNSLDNDTVRSVLVYAPTDDRNAARFQPESDTAYTKAVSHGYRSELPRLRESLSSEQYGIVADMFEQDAGTGDEFLAVPSQRIAEVYNPKAALQALAEGHNPAYSSEAADRAQEAIGIFERSGIQADRLGLYGGLQCSLVHTDGKEINDVDVLIDGLNAYDQAVDLARGNTVDPRTFPGFIASHAVKRAVAIRRGQLSQFRLPEHPDTTVDIRLVRTPEDGHEVATMLTRPTLGEVVTITSATVVDAHESLSVPARYKLQTPEGQAWSVVTDQYHHLGAAGEGDVVSVYGRAASVGVIALTEPDRHHIYMPALS